MANTVRFSMMLVQGMLLGLNLDFQFECWPLYLALMTGGLAGMGLGNLLAPRVDQAHMQQWLALFLVSGSVLMICSPYQMLSAAAAVLVTVVAVLTAASPLVRASRQYWHHICVTAKANEAEELECLVSGSTAALGIELISSPSSQQAVHSSSGIDY